MDPGFTIGMLAVFTIGSVLLFALLHTRSFLRDPKNRFHMANVWSRNGKSATARAEAAAAPGTSIPLKVRLDDSIASAHPAMPGHPTQAARLSTFNDQKV